MGRGFAVCRSAGFALVVALLVGCSSDGSYTAAWRFFVSPDAIGDADDTEPATAACGKHGVDAILVNAVSAGGERHQTTALCTAGGLANGIGAAEWQFTFVQLDVRGQVIPPPDGVEDPVRTA